MADRTVWGVIAKDAEILSGTGFDIDHTNDGVYTIFFDEPFAVLPSVTATQIYPGDVVSQGGNPLDNVVIIGITTDKFRIKTGDAAGNTTNRSFTFLAIGI